MSDTIDLQALKTDSSNEGEGFKPGPELVTWIMSKVNRWRTQRDSTYSSDWIRYYRIWRGRWDPSLKGKQAERSKIITPVSQSAVDQTVAEMMDAVFGRGDWVVLSDPPPNPQAPPQAAPQQRQPPAAPQPPPVDYSQLEEEVRDNLLADLHTGGIKRDLKRVFYNGGIYGTGIAKAVETTQLDGTRYLCWEPVAPNSFVMDTAAMTIDEALGCAHETVLPIHIVKEKQASGEYWDDESLSSVAGYGATDILNKSMSTDLETVDAEDGIYFTEYHGKVPKYLLKGKTPKDDNQDLMEDSDDDSDEDDEFDYVEAIVCIGNGTGLLSAQENDLKDRGFIAYQHHESPDSFFGIGVVEKAFNSQVALDGEVRARMDALALITYPTVGIDSTRMPSKFDPYVTPGKIYRTNGPPNEIIQAIQFGTMNGASFQQSADLERYAQMATGASDPASPINANSTASGQSMASSSFIKRSKLTMQSVDVFLDQLVRKSILRYSKMNPQRYPRIPYFTVNSTMSIVAREFEQMQMTNLLAVVPQQSPAFPIILKGIIDNYSGPQKDQIIAAIDKSMKPDPAAQAAAQKQQELQMAGLEAGVAKTKAEADEVSSRVGVNQAKAQETQAKAQVVPITAQIQAAQVQASHKTADNQARQIEVEAAKAHIDHYHRERGHMHEVVKNYIAHKKAMQPVASAPQE